MTSFSKALLAPIFLAGLSSSLLAQYNCMHTKQQLAQAAVPSTNNNAKSDTFDILHYDIALDLYGVGQQSFKAVSTIQLRSKVNLATRINLDLLKLSVDTVLARNASGSPLAQTYSYNDSLLAIELNIAPNVGDTVELEIHYQGWPETDASGWGGFHKGSGYFYNLGVGFAADPHTFGRAWFPCYDNFVEKSTYSLSVLSKAPMQALISGDQISRQILGGDSLLATARLDQPIPTYLVSFALANYAFLEDTVQGLNGELDILLAAKPADTTKLKGSFVNLKPTLHAFEHYFGPYQWPRIGYAATTVGAMEHATSIHYPINLINGNLNGEDIMAHELAHHWFGNLITCETAEDMWINEGMAEFCSHLYEEYVYGADRYHATVRQNAWNVIRLAHVRDGGYAPLYGPSHNNVYGYHTYQKGAMVGHNLRHYLGDSLFFNSLKQLFLDHAYGNLNTADFRDELIRISGKSELQDFWQDWIYSAGFPQFSVEDWSYAPLIQRLNVDIKQRLHQAPAFYNKVPVQITAFDSTGQALTFTVEHSGESSSTNGLLCPFEPEVVVASYAPQLLTATGVDEFVIDSNGTFTGSYTPMSVETTNWQSPAKVILQHHLVAPQKKSSNQFDFRLGQGHYFGAYQIGGDGNVVSATLNFDGSVRGDDQDLLTNGNDSLVVLYREKGAKEWTLYPYQQKQVVSPNSRVGSFKLSKLMNGEYCLANSKETIGILAEKTSTESISVFPNPVEDELYFKDQSEVNAWKIKVFSAGGKTILTEETRDLDGYRLDLRNLEKGLYQLQVNEQIFALIKR